MDVMNMMEITIDSLRELCNQNAVRWTEHIALRLLKRRISRRQVIEAVMSGTIIEQYPDDYPYPSCLILGHDADGNALHVVCGYGPAAAWMVTSYYPDLNEWEEDLKTRRS